MKVIYYRLWSEISPDQGTWDTDSIILPDETPREEVERVVREALDESQWAGGVSPLATGVLYVEGEQPPESTVEVEVFDIIWPPMLDFEFDLPERHTFKVPSSLFNRAVEEDFEAHINQWILESFQVSADSFDYQV